MNTPLDSTGIKRRIRKVDLQILVRENLIQV